MNGVGDVGEQFVKRLDDYIVAKDKENQRQGSNCFKPSGIYSCKRELYYMRFGVAIDYNFNQQGISICETGSHRHEIIQQYLESMSKEGYGDIEWVDVGEYLLNNGGEKYGTVVVEKKGMETKLRNHIYDFSFLCDGIVKFKDTYYILEIKTCTSMIFNKLTEPLEKHRQQVTCYSMATGIDNVIFIYENRDVLTHKGFYYKVTDTDKLLIANKIADIGEYVARGELPPKEKDKCKYCDYKELCRKDYNPKEEE